MNPEYPPLQFRPPKVVRLRPDSGRVVPPKPVDFQERVDKAKILRAQVKAVRDHVRALTPEQRRAVFLKLTHDRPLTPKDLAGTGLKPMSSLFGSETLVIPRGETLEKLDKRLAGVEGAAETVVEPKGQALGMALTSISPGQPTDRLSRALREKYAQLVRETFIIFELEVTSFKPTAKSRKKEVAELVSALHKFVGLIEGRIYESESSDDGARVLLWATGTKFKELVEFPQWQRTITFFDERPRFQTFHQVVSDFSVKNVTVVPPSEDAETICVIDSGVAIGNPLLAPVVKRDLCRSYVPNCEPTVDEIGHGSGIASLAAFYDIDPTAGSTLRARAWIASARILNEDGYLDKTDQDDEGRMRVVHARLLSSLLRQIVTEYHALGVRIFVLAFNIPGHYWSEANRGVVSRSGWVARTVDQLCREFDVVFVTITGNIEAGEVEKLNAETAYPAYLKGASAKVLDPGQAALALTAGSIAHSERVAVQNATGIAREDQPSPFTRTGPGFGSSIKPDFVERGGNFVRDNDSGRVSTNVTTSVLMASNKLTPALQTNAGTSFAAPRVAYHAAVAAHELRQVGVQASAPLIRAVLAASAECPSDIHNWCMNELGDLDASLSTVGHGLPSSSHALECSDCSVMLYFQTELEVGKVAIFELPVPPELTDTGRGPKRIVVSLATSPPVQQWGLGEYLGAEAKFRLFRGDVSPAEVEEYLAAQEDASRAKPDIDEHQCEIGLTRRSVGCLQRETYDWKQHGKDYSTHPYLLAVLLKGASWLSSGERISLGIAVRLEDRTDQCKALYASVRAAVEVEAEAEAMS